MKEIFLVFVLIMFAFVPNSTNGELPTVERIIIDWVILAITIIMAYITVSKLIRANVKLAVAILIYLFFITVIITAIDSSARISVARVAPIFSMCCLFCLKLEKIYSMKFLILLLDVFMFICIIWNLTILFGYEPVKEFTIEYYTQFYALATTNAMILAKPVMSFSIYTFASFFYTLFFYLSYKTYKKFKTKRHYFYCVSLLLINLMLISNTSLIFTLVMLYMLYRLNKRSILSIALGIFVIGIPVYLIISNPAFTAKYFTALSNENNGFLGRYFGSTTSLTSNFSYLDKNFFIGYTIIDNFNLTYTDSGYILFYLMGGLPLVVLAYWMLYNFLYKNLNKSDFYFALVIILIFEIALPSLIYIKFMYMVIFFIVYLNNLSKVEEEKSSLNRYY